MSRRTREHYEICLKLYKAMAHSTYALDVFGDVLAERHKLPPDLSGMEAVNFYLVKKFGWTPSVVRDMSTEDKRLALTEDLKDFTFPQEAIFPMD